MRNLVIGTDGTWNKPDHRDRGRQIPSNVVKILRAADENAQECIQLKYYDTGVGTAGFLDKIRGGLIGNGLFTNMRDAYQWILENHEPDDRLFLFGFSRGAFTVRSLAGMLGLCGIPNRQALQGGAIRDVVNEAALSYRTNGTDARRKTCEEFRLKYDCRDAAVRFLGVWDTVGALGLPTHGPIGRLTRRRHRFHNLNLGANVENAYHALAIHERRGPFVPTLWQGQARPGQTVVQAWFAGVHSNVGGGYVDAGLSDRSLIWMLQKAESCGLILNQEFLRRRIDPNWFGEVRDSMSWMYRTPLTGKSRARDIGTGAMGECLHTSAQGRWSSSTRPDEMPENLRAALDAGLPVCD